MTPPSKTDLEELLREATPLPWRVLGRSIGASGDHWSVWGPEWHIGESMLEDDARLAAASVNALPALLAERKQLRELLEENTDAMVSWMREAGDMEGADAAVAELRSLLAEQEATDEHP